MAPEAIAIGGAIFGAGLMVSYSIRHLADRVENNARLLEGIRGKIDSHGQRIGTLIDNLWSPLKGISNAQHDVRDEGE